MEDIVNVFASLAAIGMVLGAIAMGAAPRPPPSEFDHPRPQVELRPAPSKATEVSAIEHQDKPKQPHIQVPRQPHQNVRLSEEAANAHAEEPPARPWSLLDIH